MLAENPLTSAQVLTDIDHEQFHFSRGVYKLSTLCTFRRSAVTVKLEKYVVGFFYSLDSGSIFLKASRVEGRWALH